MDFHLELAAARAAADAAGRIILNLYASFERIADAPSSISTQADRDAQDAILNHLAARFPGDAYRAEESTPTLARLLRHGPRLWVIDPIDGTRGFAMKNGEFSVMIALCVDGEAVVGVVAEPAGGRATYAVRGAGCWCDDGRGARAVRVSRVADLSGATLTQSHTKPQRGPQRAVVALAPRRVLETYSAGVKLALVARGEADLYPCDYDALNDWDLAAGHVLVDEAGGRVTDLRGRPIRYGSEPPAPPFGVLATNGLLHDTVLARLRR